LPLLASRSEAGLFPSTSAMKAVAQKCLAEGYFKVARTETRGKLTCDFYALSDSGWEFLLAHVNPKQVLEDFVRVLESRQGEVDGLLAVATRMADSLEGLKEAVARVLPQITTGKLIRSNPRVGEESFSPPPLGEGPGVGFLPRGIQHMNGIATLES